MAQTSEQKQPSATKDPVALLRSKNLTGNTLPKRFLTLCALGAAVIGLGLSYLVSAPSFNPALWFIFGAAVFLLGSYSIARYHVNKRTATDVLWRSVVYLAFIVALIPLVWVIWSVTTTGFAGMTNPGFFTDNMQGVSQSRERQIFEGERGMMGGVYHAIVGSVLVTLTATIISVPIGLLTSIYLVEYARGGALSRGITFFVDVMTGIPSIVAGLVGAGAVQTILGAGNAWESGALVLAITGWGSPRPSPCRS